jgi:hypothetical protein
MKQFEVGDYVRRINLPHGQAVVGGVYKIKRILDNMLEFEGFNGFGSFTYGTENFELFEPSTKSESEIVKAWLEKLLFVMTTDTSVHQQLYIGQEDLILSTDFADIHGAGKVAEFVSYRYDIMQKEIAKANRQSLLDKKAELELQLAQINEQLGE